MTSKLSSVLFPGSDGSQNNSMSHQYVPRRQGGVLTTRSDQKVQNGSQQPDESDRGNVRFASAEETIEPVKSLTDNDDKRADDLSPEAHEQIRNLAMTLQKSRLQESRMANFAYEPVSMPTSRVGSSSTYLVGHC
jgi:hypothetical protein